MTELRPGPLRIAAGPKTDFFVHPGTGDARSNAEARLEAVDGDFVLSARVEVTFASTFDAGALFVWGDEGRWAKLAFELSPQGERMVVSVVTRGRSDDCNSTVIDGDAVWLRVARIGEAYAFHSSLDGETWDVADGQAAWLPEPGRFKVKVLSANAPEAAIDVALACSAGTPLAWTLVEAANGVEAAPKDTSKAGRKRAAWAAAEPVAGD